MIAVSTSGKNFHALANYLANGRSGEEQDRVAWTAGRNLPTADPELAATFMQATVSRSDRVEKPVYYVVLSFDPKDAVDRPTIEGIADRLLARLGLAEHQAVIVAHRDRQHTHVHLFVNRVHPETRKAWERWKDQPLIQALLREEERTLGLRRVPGRLAPPVEQQVDPTDGAARAPYRGKPSRLTEEVANDLRTYERVLALAQERYAAMLAADVTRHQEAHLATASDRARSAGEAFQQALCRVYRGLAEARVAFDAAVAAQGPAPALRTLQDDPERFGALMTVQRGYLLGMARAEDDTSARSAAREAANLGSQFIVAQRAVREATDYQARAREAQAREIRKQQAREFEAKEDAANARETENGKATRREAARGTSALDREARRLPSADALEHHLGRALRAMTPREFEQLRLLVTAPQFTLAQKIQGAVRDMVLGREETVWQ